MKRRRDMKAWFEAQDMEVKLLIAGLAIYGLVYIAVSIIEAACGIHI